MLFCLMIHLGKGLFTHTKWLLFKAVNKEGFSIYDRNDRSKADVFLTYFHHLQFPYLFHYIFLHPKDLSSFINFSIHSDNWSNILVQSLNSSAIHSQVFIQILIYMYNLFFLHMDIWYLLAKTISWEDQKTCCTTCSDRR